MAALLYTVMTAMPGSVAWDEFDVVDNHFRSATEAQWLDFTGCTNTRRVKNDYIDVQVPAWSNSECKDANGKGLWVSDLYVDGNKFSDYTDPNATDPIRIGKYGCQFSEDNVPWKPMSTRLGTLLRVYFYQYKVYNGEVASTNERFLSYSYLVLMHAYASASSRMCNKA